MSSPLIFTFGEALWDCLPAGLFFGGAPINAAYHLTRRGARVAPITSVGRDFLGDEALRRMENTGLDLSWVYRDNEWPTGAVEVELDDQGSARYQFLTPVAWDRIVVTADLARAADKAEALIFGTLAQRSEQNHRELEKLLKKDHWLRVYDVNLRPPYDDPALVFSLAQYADLLKLNDDEAISLAQTSTSSEPLQEACRILGEKTSAAFICITRGKEGGLLWVRETGQFHHEKGVPIKVADTVGAGDAFLAALTGSFLQKESPQESLRQATRLGEYMATRRGAMPDYQWSEVPGLDEPK